MDRSKNYRLKFIKYTKGEYVQYLIRLMTLEDTSIGVEFFERYSTLKDLHEILKREANSINFPKFPPKKFFNSTDEKFLNQRQTALEHYFNTILGSKEFANLPSLRKWVEETIKRNYKGQTQDLSKGDKADKIEKPALNSKMPRSDSNPGNHANLINGQSFVKNYDNVQKFKEIVERHSKFFIDLNGDNNPHLEQEDSITREKNYRNLLKSSNVLDHTQSKFFKLIPGDNTHFECLGLEEPKIAPLEATMLAKLNAVSKLISVELPEEYSIDEFVLKIKLDRI